MKTENVQNLFKASLQKNYANMLTILQNFQKSLKKVEFQWLELGLNIDLVG